MKNRLTNPNLMPIIVPSVKSNPLNSEVLTVIGSGATSEGDFGSTGRLQELGINLIDYKTCNDLYGGNIVESIILCVGVPGVMKMAAKTTAEVPFSIGKARGRKGWIDATISELSSSHPVSCGRKRIQHRGWPQDYVGIEIKYDDFPTEMGWTLRDSAGTLFAGQSSTVSKTTYIAVGVHTFAMTDTCEDGICCQYGASRELSAGAAAAGSLEKASAWSDVVLVHRRLPAGALSPLPTTGWVLRTMTTRMRRECRERGSRSVLLLPRPASTKRLSLVIRYLSLSAWLFGSSTKLVILDSLGDVLTCLLSQAIVCQS
jgi:hypothetical protein